MGFAFIREGDTTSHGGRVLACSPENKSDGVPLALLGDKVSCPRCGGIYPIVGVKNLGVTFDGRPVASEGDATACGATLIAPQNNTTAEPTSGPGGAVGGGKSVVWKPTRKRHTGEDSRCSMTSLVSRSPVYRARRRRTSDSREYGRQWVYGLARQP